MRISKFIYQFAIIASVIGIFAACSKDNKDVAAPASDKSRLQFVIDSLTNVYNSTSEGSHPGQYVIGSRANLDSVIKLAMQVYSSTTFSQQEVNNALQNLLNAGQIFNTKLLQEVSVANLMGFWKMNGNADDSSGHGHNGTLKSGLLGNDATTAADGGILPQPTQDRFGRPNMAYAFNSAANIEIPYDGALNPQSLTITAWVKRNTTNSNNYILSLNRWNGFKFQLQSNNFPFFTFHDTNGNYHDVDDNPGAVPQDIWTFVAISYTNGACKFYIDGILTKTIVVTGTPVTVNPPVNLAIGNELPKSGYNLTNSNDPNYYYGASYFVGALDDIRLYNKNLSDAEVLSIYTQEKTL